MMGGSWTIVRFGGAPVRLHWSLPLGALLMSGFPFRINFVPAFWAGFVLLILIHELGHALLVLRYRLGLSEIMVHGMGGYCRHERSGTRYQGAMVAWGGVLAQLCALIVTQIVLLVAGPPSSAATAQLAYVFTETNVWMMCLNLLPIEPLDGKQAWPLVGMLLERFRRKQQAQRVGSEQRRTVQDELRALEKLDTQVDAPGDKTDRIVRDLISRTTQPKR